MKKFFMLSAFAAIAGLTMTSCSNDDYADTISAGTEQPSAITFQTQAPVSRAGDVTSLTSFKATAITSTGSTYFSNETFTFANNVFSSATPYYWPLTGTLDFFATNAGTIQYSGGKATMKINASDGLTDYVVATNRGATKTATVPLAFKHIMTRLSVKVKPFDAADGYDYQITEIRAYTKGQGTFIYPVSTGATGIWDDNTTYATYSWTTGLPAMTGKSNNAKVITPSQVFYIVPNNDMLTFDVDYRVYKNGVLIADCTGEDCGTIEIYEPGLTISKSFCYVLQPYFEAGSSESPIKFTATLTPWPTTTEVDEDLEV